MVLDCINMIISCLIFFLKKKQTRQVIKDELDKTLLPLSIVFHCDHHRWMHHIWGWGNCPHQFFLFLNVYKKFCLHTKLYIVPLDFFQLKAQTNIRHSILNNYVLNLKPFNSILIIITLTKNIHHTLHRTRCFK